METQEIRNRIKRIIHNVTNIPVDKISDNASFLEDLDLDSLALLEVGVDIDYEFKLGIDSLEENMASIATLPAIVKFVSDHLAERTVG